MYLLLNVSLNPAQFRLDVKYGNNEYADEKSESLK